MTRDQIIDYIAPQTTAFRCEHALLFGSRYGQPHLVAETVALFAGGYFERVVVCGGRTGDCDTPEAAQLAGQLVTAGMPPGRILTECASTHTGENVALARRMLGDDITELFLIGKIYAKRRCAMTVKAQWPSIRTVACRGVNHFGVPRTQWWRSPPLRARVLAEVRKIPRYLQLGYISEIAVRDGRVELDDG